MTALPTYFKTQSVRYATGTNTTVPVNSFTTPARPRITNLRFQPVTDQPTSTQQITWTTNVPASSELTYGPNGQAQQDKLDAKMTTNHKMIIEGLQDNSLYTLIAQSRDASGNLAISDKQVFHTALDTRPPKISGVKVQSSIKGTGAEAQGQISSLGRPMNPAPAR